MHSRTVDVYFFWGTQCPLFASGQPRGYCQLRWVSCFAPVALRVIVRPELSGTFRPYPRMQEDAGRTRALGRAITEIPSRIRAAAPPSAPPYRNTCTPGAHVRFAYELKAERRTVDTGSPCLLAYAVSASNSSSRNRTWRFRARGCPRVVFLHFSTTTQV